jgi:UDP-N-acetylmuramoylalanine-D-glutamate ligase
MKILVCGGRDYHDWHHALITLNWIHDERGPISLVIHGGAKGADALGQEWAKSKGIAVSAYYADWAKHGKAAGPLRNQRMVDEAKPDLVVAFPGGRGTADMVSRAKKAGISVIEALKLTA